MSRTTFQAILTITLIVIAGALQMVSSDDHGGRLKRLIAQAEDYLTGAKDAAAGVAENAQKSMGAVRDALGKAPGL